MIDYSQHGQALIIEQLITPDTPRVLVDVGASDGVTGSNSRRLVEAGWQAVLVEPLPSAFHTLQRVSAGYPGVQCIQAACSDTRGAATLTVGSDATGQMSTLSPASALSANLTDRSIEVEMLTLADILTHRVPEDFGLLLVDTEGFDLNVLHGLEDIHHRPRLIVTEEFQPTNDEKYALLRHLGYRFIGLCGSDSLWVLRSHPVRALCSPPVLAMGSGWHPSGQPVETGRACLDVQACSLASGPLHMLQGWAVVNSTERPPKDVFVRLANEAIDLDVCFRAWRTVRLDVQQHYNSAAVAMSGFRCWLQVPPGDYRVSVIQQADTFHTEHHVGTVSLTVTLS